MEERGKEEVEGEYNEGGVNEASVEELKMVNKWAFGGGIVCSACNEGTSLNSKECSREGKDLGTWWWWIVWKILQRRLATPNFRQTGRHWGGCQCHKCMGVG